MNNNEVVGELTETQSQSHIEWSVADFLSLPSEPDKRYQSPLFLFSGATWFIHIYPDGRTEKGSGGWIAIYLARTDLGPPISLTYSLFFKTANGRKAVLSRSQDSFVQLGSNQTGYSWGQLYAMKRSALIGEHSLYMPSGALTIICLLECDEMREHKAEKIMRKVMKDCYSGVDVSTQTEADTGTEKLLSDLKNLVVSGDSSDMTVKVEGEEFRLHRAIVGARTPVFHSMFKHDTREKATGVVSVDDCEAGPFRAFVHYLYTGSTDELSRENTFSLYRIADKYQVDGLKASCLEHIKRTISLDTFCDALDLALQYEERGLIDQATDFLSENASDITSTADWKNLLKKNGSEITELLVKALVIKK